MTMSLSVRTAFGQCEASDYYYYVVIFSSYFSSYSRNYCTPVTKKERETLSLIYIRDFMYVSDIQSK